VSKRLSDDDGQQSAETFNDVVSRWGGIAAFGLKGLYLHHRADSGFDGSGTTETALAARLQEQRSITVLRKKRTRRHGAVLVAVLSFTAWAWRKQRKRFDAFHRRRAGLRALLAAAVNRPTD
jgi:hypothetical protein